MKTFAATVLLIECVIISLYPNTIAQRITTIQLDGTQYFVSRMNPYSPELNYFLAYQYCRSLGLQLISFETREKADSVAQYLSNAGYTNYHFWTSGNRLGTNMYIWQSTGLPFNATFNYMKKETTTAQDVLTSPQRSSRNTDDHKCVAMTGPMFQWEPSDCLDIKDFICEQTRCYYYNYGSIPVSSAQGKPLTQTTLRPFYSTSSIPQNDTADAQTDMDNSENQISEEPHPVTVGPYNNDGNQYMAEMQADESHNDNHEDSEYASTIDPMQL